MTLPPSCRRFYRVLQAVDGHPELVVETRSGPDAIAEAERIGGWVEGDDFTVIWPTGPADGEEAWRWAQRKTWASR